MSDAVFTSNNAVFLLISAQRLYAASLNSVGSRHPYYVSITNPDSRTVEVAIHTILYIRQIYPADLFVRRKKYETPVYQSRHPGLNEYIAGAVKAISDELVLVSTYTLLLPTRHTNMLLLRGTSKKSSSLSKTRTKSPWNALSSQSRA